jgi:hypothetical protein
MKRAKYRTVVGYTVASVLLAGVGVAFAYVVSLPAALHFLTNISVENVSAMLTIDSYLSFVIAYLLAGATLFQLPLLLLIIDGVTPLPPKKLMGFQRHMIIGSFVFAAIVSPTPDVINQTILALPVVVMYQIGIILIAWRHLSLRRKVSRAAGGVIPTNESVRPVIPRVGKYALRSYLMRPETEVIQQATVRAYPRRSIDGVVRHAQADRSQLTVPVRPIRALPQVHRPTRSLDGFL